MSTESKKSPDLSIKLSKVEKDNFNDEEYIDVSLYSEDEDQGYAVDFTTWESLANKYVILAEDTALSKAEMLAEILWEITFWGFSMETINKERAKLDQAVEDVLDTNCVSFDSVEEMFREISDEP